MRIAGKQVQGQKRDLGKGCTDVCFDPVVHLHPEPFALYHHPVSYIPEHASPPHLTTHSPHRDLLSVLTSILRILQSPDLVENYKGVLGIPPGNTSAPFFLSFSSFTMNFQNPPYTPATASQRIRSLWRKFELSQTKDRAQLDITIQTALEKAEADWNKYPNNTRMSRIQRNATRAQIAKKIKAPYFDKARAKWHDMLEPFGLKPDYWTDLTDDEKRRITNTLGAEDESDEDPVMPELPPARSTVPVPAPIVQPTQPQFFQPLAPSFSTSSRATNLSSSSYALVNPSEFNSEEEDFEYETPLSNPVVTSVDLTSEDDDDLVASIPKFPGARQSLVGSAFSRASLSASNPSNTTPSARPLVSGFAYNAAPNEAVPTKRPPPPQQTISQNEGKSTITKARIPRQPYVGPSLDAADEPIDEELEFEKFKMRTRMEKIVEFHEAAALAEISLSIEMYKARKQLNNSKEEDAPRVLDHQKRMVQLQKEKEEERKAIVKSERARRQSDLARRLIPGDVKEVSMSNGAFKTWDFSSFQEEINLPSRFNLDTLLSDDPAKQQTNVESLLSEMFADDYQPSGPDGSVPSLINSSSTSPNSDAFHGSSSIYNQQEQYFQSHPSMSWSKTRSNSSPKPPRKPHLSLFDESSDEEGGGPAAGKPNAPAPAATTSAWLSKNGTTPIAGSAWSSKMTTAPVTQRSSVLSDPNPSFVMDEIEPELNAIPSMNSKVAKGKKSSVSASDKSPVPPSTVETATASSKAPVSEIPAVPPVSTPALAPAPVGKKQSKKQRQAANKKGGPAAAPATVAATAIPEQEPEPEPVHPQRATQRESPKLETPVAASNPIPQASEHTSWLPKTVPAMARARMDPEPPTTPSFSWDEITSTPRPAPKIPAHVQETLKSEGTPRPTMLKKKNLMAEIFNATSSRTTLEQMPPAPAAKGPVWGAASTPGLSLWGKTKADFETANPAQQLAGGDPWVPGGFDGVDDYKDEGDGGGGGGGNEKESLWGPMTSHSKQNGKAASISVKQQQPSVAAQRLRRVSEAASSPAPRGFGTKDLSSDIGQPAPPTVNSNSKKAQGKKNGKGKQRATIEVVSDEEKDNIDILPQDSNYIMEPKVILEPKPSVPPFVYNPIIDFTDDIDINDIGYLTSTFRPTASTASSSSQDDFFGSQSRFSNTFKTQGMTTSMGATDWGTMSGKHARWTPAVSNDEEESGSPNFPGSVGPRLQAKPSVQQTPIWGQPNPSAKDKGKGKK